MCNNKCNNNCEGCDCKISTDEVVYKGPNLECLGIENCDTLTTVLTKIDEKLCSTDLVNIIVNNIQNNPLLLNQFTEIVNSNIDCDVVINCVTETTTLI